VIILLIKLFVANEDTKEQRLLIAEACLNDMIDWLDKGGQVGIYDASNTTDERRSWIQQKLNEHNIQTLFIGKLHIYPPPKKTKTYDPLKNLTRDIRVHM
jgi:hypothetical protein